jgi:hypothetical protein
MKNEGGSLNPRSSSGRHRSFQRGWGGSLLIAVSVLVGAAGALSGDASAQDADEESDSEEHAVDLTPPDALGEAAEANLSAAGRLDRGKRFVTLIERAAQSIQRQLQEARKDRDVVRVLCLNDKLNQVDVALRSAQDRLDSLKAAADRNDKDRAKHEYTVLEVLSDRVRVLVNESNQCVGEETGFIGEAEVSVTVDPNLPDPDTGFGPDFSGLPPLPNISSPIE